MDNKTPQGSYSRKSFLSLRNLGENAKKKELPSSRTSLSQLKLNLLTDGKDWEILEDYGLEELRDGFFDPIFTKHENVITSEEGDDIETTPKKEPRKRVTEQISDNMLQMQQNWQSMLKFSLAFFIAICICLIHPSGKWLGHRYRYFMPIAVLLHHPARNIGIQVEMTIGSVAGAAFGMAWSALAWYISVATKPAANHQGGILFASMFLAVFFSSWLQAAKQRLLYFSLSYGIAICFLHTVDLVTAKSMLDWKLYWDFGIPYLFGLLLSLIVCVVVYPHAGQSEIVTKFSSSVRSIKHLLVKFLELDECGNLEMLHSLQKKIGNRIDFDVSEGMREFLNQFTITKIDEASLLTFRNTITFAAAPLRSMPTDHKLLTKVELEEFYHECQGKFNEGNEDTSNGDTNMPVSGVATPLPSALRPLKFDEHTNKQMYISVLRSAFSRSLLELLVEMIALLETIENALETFTHYNVFHSDSADIEGQLNGHIHKLKRKIYNLDVSYKEFTASNFFSKDLLSDPQSIDSFLFLRYLRQSAKNMIPVATCVIGMSTNLRWRIELPHYPLRRALNRLPHRCSIDQGAKSLLHYFETKSDVDDIFEELYNSYTSKHKMETNESNQKGKIKATVRAIDHKDFSLHTTTHPLRYKLWLISSQIISYESRWALKIAIVMTFLALPSWLPQSFKWYQEYQCWWAPLSLLILANRRHSGNWPSMGRRIMCALTGVFWGWCANQARHFGSPYVVATFAGLLCFVLSFNFFANNHTKSSFTGLACFVIIALEPYSKSNQLNTAGIWKNTWITGLSLLCGIALSIPINWILWSFTARQELRLSVSSLLAHMSQSYQSVTDRYLYRDANDAPTDLTLQFSSIREVRLSQSLIAVRRLLQKAREEPNYILEFKADVYAQLLDCCEYMLEKMVEARISGQYFEVWDQDNNSAISRALLSLRRDSVSSVIFVLYMLSNCFVSRNKIPMYLPNSIMSRKKLFDFISKFEATSESRSATATAVSKSESAGSENKERTAESPPADYDKSHWTQIHGMAFARAFTDISEVVQKLANLSRQILGEEMCS